MFKQIVRPLFLCLFFGTIQNCALSQSNFTVSPPFIVRPLPEYLIIGNQFPVRSVDGLTSYYATYTNSTQATKHISGNYSVVMCSNGTIYSTSTGFTLTGYSGSGGDVRTFSATLMPGASAIMAPNAGVPFEQYYIGYYNAVAGMSVNMNNTTATAISNKQWKVTIGF